MNDVGILSAAMRADDRRCNRCSAALVGLMLVDVRVQTDEGEVQLWICRECKSVFGHRPQPGLAPGPVPSMAELHHQLKDSSANLAELGRELWHFKLVTLISWGVFLAVVVWFTAGLGASR